jgi:hypothetical protein
MNQSETIGKLSDALAKAQAELKNPHFDSTNPHFKSKFASLGAVRESVIPVFAKHNIAVTQWPLSADGHAGCRTVVSHGGEWMAQDFLIPVDKHNAHGYASAVTYAKRISLQSIACVVGDVDDDGNQAVGDNTEGKRKPIEMKQASGGAFNEACFEAMPKEEQEFLQSIADKVGTYLNEGADMEAYAFIEAQRLDDQEKPALWSLLKSGQRSAIKKAGEALRLQQKAAEAAADRKAA